MRSAAPGLLALLLLLAGLAPLSAAAPPEAVVGRLLDALTRPAGDFEARVQALGPVIRQTHDLEAIARVSIGTHWHGLPEEQRRRLVGTLARLSIATYARRFAGGASVRFSQPVRRDHDERRAAVRATLFTADAREVVFDFLLHHSEGEWRIVNIITDGISDLALRRSEYTSIIEREGFAALLERLEAKIRELANGNP